MLHGQKSFFKKKKKKRTQHVPTPNPWILMWLGEKGRVLLESCGALGNSLTVAGLRLFICSIYLMTCLAGDGGDQVGQWLSHSAQCLAHSRCSGNLLPLSSSWSLSWLNLSSSREAIPCIYWSRIKNTFQIFTMTNPSCFSPVSSPCSFWWLRKESFQYGVLWKEDPLVLSDYGSYWPHMAVECLKCG